MGFFRRHSCEVGEREFELVRDAYRHTRAWEHKPVRRLFASSAPGRSAEWRVACGVIAPSVRPADDLPGDLLQLPSGWGFDRFEIREIRSANDRIVVVGACLCRPSEKAKPVKVPFLHVWYMRGGRVERVESRLNFVELRRAL